MPGDTGMECVDKAKIDMRVLYSQTPDFSLYNMQNYRT